MDPLTIVIIGGAAYLLYTQGFFSGGAGGVLPSSRLPYSVTPPNLAGVPPPGAPVQSRSGVATAITAGTSVAGALLGSVGTGTTVATSTATGATAAGGAGLTTIALTAGIAAGGVLLTWAIAQKGLFRGGWEGITGNRIRDVFFQQFIDIYYPGRGSEMQYSAIVQAFIDIGEGHRAEAMIGQLYAADTEAEMKAATRAIADLFIAHGVPISAPRL